MPGRDIRLLSLDNGGLRGLSALVIVQQLMKKINPDAPPKPSDYFGMICGSGTGGLIAIMLGRLKMSTEDCIEAYLHLSNTILATTRRRAKAASKFDDRIDVREFKDDIKRVITAQGLLTDTLLKETSDAAFKVFVCARKSQDGKPVCLTSYECLRDNDESLKSISIWEACCATLAISPWYLPFKSGQPGFRFADTVSETHNPVGELWNQYQLILGPEPLEDRIRCLVSIGALTHMPNQYPDHMTIIDQSLVGIAAGTQLTARQFGQSEAQLGNCSWYFRFNAGHRLADLGYDELAEREQILATTLRYIASPVASKLIQDCVDRLCAQESKCSYKSEEV